MSNEENNSKIEHNEDGSIKLKYSAVNADTIPKEWVIDEGDFTYFMLMNTPFCATDFLVTPNARINDNSLDLVYIKNGTVKNALRILLDTESGKYVKEPFVVSHQIRALHVELKGKTGFVDIDGELALHKNFNVEILPSLLKITVPPYLDERNWAK